MGILDAPAASRASILGPLSGGYEAWDRFADHASGVPVAAPSGQTYLMNGTSSATTTVSGGQLIAVAPNNAVATYVQLLLTRAGSRIGATFAFSPGATTAGGTACIGFWTEQMDNLTSTLPRDCPVHLVVSPGSWSFGVWKDGVITDLRYGTFPTPLVADGVTEHTTEVYLDRASSTCVFTLPDGSVQSITHPTIGLLDARYAFIEHFRSAPTDTLPLYTSWWADSTKVGTQTVARLLADVPGREAALSYMPTTPSPYTAPTGTSADVDATNLALTFTPKTSRALVTLTGYVKVYQPCLLYWSVRMVTSSFGSAKVIGQADRTTALYAAVAAGATSIQTNARAMYGVCMIDVAGSVPEAAYVVSLSGSSAPFTANLAWPLTLAHAVSVPVSAGAAVALDGSRTARILVTGLTPGSTVVLKWGHLSTATNAAILQCDSATSSACIMSAVSV